MICINCKVETNVLYMCDQDEEGSELCGPCFEKTDCGQGLHEEGCETMVVESES